VTVLTLVPAKQTFFSGSFDRTIMVWNMATENEPQQAEEGNAAAAASAAVAQ